MAIEAEALLALRLTLRIVDRAAGEGLMFLKGGQRMPAMEAADICHSVADALGIEPGGPEYMALIGDGPLPTLIHRSALAEDTARAAEGWQPIETAPENALIEVLMRKDEIIGVLERRGKIWWTPDLGSFSTRHFTHWRRPPPALPLTKEAAHGER